ncbi:hypothetical protein PsorP6_007135 [Peronosclerospora sorghi]|uniref:Uncharacterized protein n=1 Tax=Peronosclerospora sorghi TaxID=230839 RepID=A0ACC0W6Q2_9STRA|nr:hypothetical protein PsorP6_007135 [Peronosclerospora sorghi]
MQMIMAEDGALKTMAIKTMALKRVHEKKWEKRKRKREEQNVRRANRRVGSLIDFILRRKKAYLHATEVVESIASRKATLDVVNLLLHSTLAGAAGNILALNTEVKVPNV